MIDFSNLPSDYIQFDLGVSMHSLAVFLVNEFAQHVLKVKLKRLAFHSQISNEALKLNLTLQHFYVQDLWARVKSWPYLVGTKTQSSIQSSKRLSLIKLQTNAVEIDFESSKKFVTCPFKLVVDFNRPLLMVANLPLLMETSRTMSVALQNEKLDLDYFVQLALNHIVALRDKTQDLAESIKKGAYQHQNFDITALIQAPILIVPSDIFTVESTFLRVDLGEIRASSDLQKYKKGFDYKAIKDEEQLYDKYFLTATGLSVSIQDPSIQKESHQLLKDLECRLSLSNCLEPLHPLCPSFKAHFEFTRDVQISFDWTSVEQLIRMKNMILVQLEN